MRAECTWGHGPDVLLILNDSAGQFEARDLTIEQAQMLARQLDEAAQNAIDIERQLDDYMQREEV